MANSNQEHQYIHSSYSLTEDLSKYLQPGSLLPETAQSIAMTYHKEAFVYTGDGKWYMFDEDDLEPIEIV
jgi:hypothetical protein